MFCPKYVIYLQEVSLVDLSKKVNLRSCDFCNNCQGLSCSRKIYFYEALARFRKKRGLDQVATVAAEHSREKLSHSIKQPKKKSNGALQTNEWRSLQLS